MASRRSGAGAALVAALSASSAGAFAPPDNFTAHRRIHVPDEKDDLPSAVVFDGGAVEIEDRGGDLYENVDEFAVVGRAIGTATGDPDDAIDPVYLWICRSIMADPQLGGAVALVKKIGREPTRATDGDRVYVSVIVRFQVTYQTRRDDPEAAS